MAYALLFCGFLAAEVKLPEDMKYFALDLNTFMPEATRVRASGRTGVYAVLDQKGKQLGLLYLERIPDIERVEGYAGTIEIAVLFGNDERVAGVLIGKNRETKAWLRRVRAAKFLERWNKLKMSEIPDKDVDAVSRATYSSNAIKAGVRKLAESYLKEEKKVD